MLLRALAPSAGLDAMRARRGLADPRRLCAGPGRLAQALGIDLLFDGVPVDGAPFAWEPPAGPVNVAATTRIGITKGADTPWRFLLAGSPFVSRPLPRRSLPPPTPSS